MSTDLARPIAPGTSSSAGRRPPRNLSRPAGLIRGLGPNWYASVMGTGIVATAAATLPVQVPGLRAFATVVWLACAAWLVTLTAGFAVQLIRHRGAARGHALDPVMVQFYGAPPMAALTVGAGALLLGPAVIGTGAAVAVDAVLWTAGTLTGIASTIAVPYLMFTRGGAGSDAAFGGWLMPIVPPMVSAATGALLVPYIPAGQA
ncbi:MAG: C4-dicarboxylate ABC transporter, partial [Actinomycetota bacterium]|nr:C4-dicarboxylate ABC transporter [Actinomycetota bacterium]